MKKRARDLGIPFRGTPGRRNAITDVSGVEVGHTTIVRGAGKLVIGKGPVRTGVTAILPRGGKFDPVFAGWYALNGNGEMTGTTWIEESGFLETPVLLTNTFSVGVARDSALAWMAEHNFKSNLIGDLWYAYPVVSETYDGQLNDIAGQHVTRKDVFAALDAAKGGAVTEGNVGSGTGMICHGFKGGIGTSSRKTEEGHTVGVLVQANQGTRKLFTVAGVPVGEEITDLMPEVHIEKGDNDTGSIVVVVATDAPLIPLQLERLCRRVPIGIGLVGGRGGNESGDIFLAFSTANPGVFSRMKVAKPAMLPNDEITPLFEAVVDATEEAIINALVAAETMTGINGNKAYALPLDRLRKVLKNHNRLTPSRK
ncbi:MAG TPA: P1 family peptidase [Bacteroidota bacterium]|nr:P1 family peptidase [Bacteroidota bacterium]